MKLKYKGWFISAYPTKDPDKIHWNILLENNIGENQIQTRSFDVHPAMTLKAVEDLAFDKIKHGFCKRCEPCHSWITSQHSCTHFIF